MLTDKLVEVFDFFADKTVEGYEYNTASVENLMSAADACCDAKLDARQAITLLAGIRTHAACTTENQRWYARAAVLEALQDQLPH